MSLAAVLAAGPSVAPPRVRCGVAVLLEKVRDVETRDAIVDAVTEKDVWQGEALARLLRADGHAISGPTIQRHRRGECTCGTR